MEPIKHKAYEEILKLLEGLTKTKIADPTGINVQYNLLNQIFTITYFWMNENNKAKHKKMGEECLNEMIKRNKGQKETFFSIKENEWERELRCFCLEQMKEDDLGVDGL